MADKSANTGRFESYLQAHPFNGQPGNLYEAMNYIMRLGGKRLRPELLLLAYNSVAGNISEDAFKLALAIETFHTFSLVHDDIMDNAPVRRGQPAVHEKWDKATAILAGDNLLIQCYSLILDTGFQNRELLLRSFTDMATQVCEGQQMDMNLPLEGNITEEIYLEMIRLKTAVLPACALKMGAIAANSEPDVAEHLYQFGINLGMAFQLMDDYLDCFGESHETGKQEGGDIIENKKTILYLHALEYLDALPRQELWNWYTHTEDSSMAVRDKVDKVRALYRQAGSDDYLMELKSGYEQKALDHLDMACAEGQGRDGFMLLFEFLKMRKA